MDTFNGKGKGKHIITWQVKANNWVQNIRVSILRISTKHLEGIEEK